VTLDLRYELTEMGMTQKKYSDAEATARDVWEKENYQERRISVLLGQVGSNYARLFVVEGLKKVQGGYNNVRRNMVVITLLLGHSQSRKLLTYSQSQRLAN
jgi:hypothetical protein